MLKSSNAYPLMFLMIDSSDHITGKTGLTPTVTISKAGAAFASPAGSVTEISAGWYKVAGNATDTNTDGPLLLHATSAGADPTDMVVGVVVEFDPRNPPTVQTLVDGVLDEATSAHLDAGSTGLAIYTASITTTIKKNVAYSNFPIFMKNSAGNPLTGLTDIACQVAGDASAYANLADGTEAEIGSGKYVVDLAQGETNFTSFTIRCTSASQGARPYEANVTPQR
jgi:hypothetical protein